MPPNETNTTIQNGTNQGAAGTPPAAVPPVPPTATPPVQAAPAPPPAIPPAAPTAPTVLNAERIPTKKLLSDSDEAIPEGVEVLEMSTKGFKNRIQRATKSALKEQFGTDNVEDILKWKADLDTYKKKEEDQKLAEMSESERWKTQYEKQKADYETLQQKYESTEFARIVDHEDRRITAHVATMIDTKYLRTELPRLAAYLKGCSEADLANDEPLIAEWCKKQIADCPWMAPGYAPAAPIAADGGGGGQTPPAAAPVVPVPISNGAEPNRGGIAAPSLAQKTPTPNQPNSMSDTEWRKFKRDNNLHF